MFLENKSENSQISENTEVRNVYEIWLLRITHKDMMEE